MRHNAQSGDAKRCIIVQHDIFTSNPFQQDTMDGGIRMSSCAYETAVMIYI